MPGIVGVLTVVHGGSSESSLPTFQMLYIYGRRWCALYAADLASGLFLSIPLARSLLMVEWQVCTAAGPFLPPQVQPQVIVLIVFGGVACGTSSAPVCQCPAACMHVASEGWVHLR